MATSVSREDMINCSEAIAGLSSMRQSCSLILLITITFLMSTNHAFSSVYNHMGSISCLDRRRSLFGFLWLFYVMEGLGLFFSCTVLHYFCLCMIYNNFSSINLLTEPLVNVIYKIVNLILSEFSNFLERQGEKFSPF